MKPPRKNQHQHYKPIAGAQIEIPLQQNAKALNIERGIETIRSYLASLGGQPGVYQMFDQKNNPLYVGKARILNRRVASYTRPHRLPVRLQRMIANTFKMEFITTQTEGEALLLEANLIKKLAPRYNILLRDDKNFPYIQITNHLDFPRVIKYRGAINKNGKYFGPYASASSVNHTLTILQRVFGLRDCSDNVFANRTRACLQYYIKRCSGPCAHHISKSEYAYQIKQAEAFLNGQTRKVQTEMASLMEHCSANLDFEKAALLRDQIKALNQIQAHQDIHLKELGNVDLFAIQKQNHVSAIQAFFVRNGIHHGGVVYHPRHDQNADHDEIMSAFIGQFYTTHQPAKHILVNLLPQRHDLLEQALSQYFNRQIKITKPQRGTRLRAIKHAERNAKEELIRKINMSLNHQTLLDKLAQLCQLDHAIKRIEVYDNSHMQGSDAVGAMVVISDEGFAKQSYRMFNIKADSKTKTNDDYAMMAQIMERRFKRALNEDHSNQKKHTYEWPDIVILDGGKGQLSAAQQVFQKLGVEHLFKVFAVSKGIERNAGLEELHFLSNDGKFKSMRLGFRDPLNFFIQRMRDESHRFVIGTHRKKRIKTQIN
ncbi:MAG: excinuclease ABC subunit UvrC, partial [Pseudomonadota bacterium]